MVVPGSSPRSRVVGGRRSIGVVAALGVLAVVLWWWWPGVVGDPDDIDVRLAVGPGLSVADQSLDRRLREEGFLLERTPAPADWCDAARLIGEAPRDGSRIVVWASSSADCVIADAVADMVAAAAGRRLVVVHLPTDDPETREAFEQSSAFDTGDVRIVDTTRLLGEPGARFECLWWEDCPESGAVEPWDGDALGPIGAERLARMVVTETL